MFSPLGMMAVILLHSVRSSVQGSQGTSASTKYENTDISENGENH